MPIKTHASCFPKPLCKLLSNPCAVTSSRPTLIHFICSQTFVRRSEITQLSLSNCSRLQPVQCAGNPDPALCSGQLQNKISFHLAPPPSSSPVLKEPTCSFCSCAPSKYELSLVWAAAEVSPWETPTMKSSWAFPLPPRVLFNTKGQNSRTVLRES